MSDDLKPCPFCGATDLQIERSQTRQLWEVECYACWGMMTSATSQSKAEYDWNRRRPEDALRARAEAAEQRAEAAEAALAQVRADRTLMTSLWLVTVPPRELPALLPTDQADRDRLADALDAVDRQTGAEARTAAGRAVIARIVAETGGGAA